jgi:hypothetical protein
MDYLTARDLIMAQGMATDADADALLTRLRQGHPPIPGQVTSLLLALKIIFENLKQAPGLQRDLACALYRLALSSRIAYHQGQQAGVEWPMLLNEDLTRIAHSVDCIFSDQAL